LAKVLPSLLPAKPQPIDEKPEEKPEPKPPKTQPLKILTVNLSGFLRFFPAGSCRRLYVNAPLVIPREGIERMGML